MIRLPKNAVASPEALARFMFSQQAAWVTGLMRVREVFARVFRLNTTLHRLLDLSKSEGSERIHYFKIYSSNDREVILGEDDHHLDFRLSILYRKPDESQDKRPHLIVSTVVNCHNRLGRAYLFIITPFHRLVVRSGLRRAFKAGWPTVK